MVEQEEALAAGLPVGLVGIIVHIDEQTARLRARLRALVALLGGHLKDMETIYQVDRSNPAYRFPLVETSGLEDTFLQLAEQWRRETGLLSLVSKMIIHPAYQRIIGMGQPVVPLILRDLEQEPDHWFWALQAITGEDPVPQEARGNLDQMAATWIKWGHERGYRW